jgi:hypothetical protein
MPFEVQRFFGISITKDAYFVLILFSIPAFFVLYARAMILWKVPGWVARCNRRPPGSASQI